MRGLKPKKLITNNWDDVYSGICLLDLFQGVGGVSATVTIAEFLESFYGLYLCMP